jgi:hypothetical protein
VQSARRGECAEGWAVGRLIWLGRRRADGGVVLNAGDPFSQHQIVLATGRASSMWVRERATGGGIVHPGIHASFAGNSHRKRTGVKVLWRASKGRTHFSGTVFVSAELTRYTFGLDA